MQNEKAKFDGNSTKQVSTRTLILGLLENANMSKAEIRKKLYALGYNYEQRTIAAIVCLLVQEKKLILIYTGKDFRKDPNIYGIAK